MKHSIPVTAGFVWLLSVVVIPSALCLSLPTSTTSRRELFYSASSISSTLTLGGCIISPANAIDLTGYTDGPRGLKYAVTKVGNPESPKPKRAQEVKAAYTLFLDGFEEDGGKKIDSSKGFFGDQPFKFLAGVGQVIPGWDLAIMDMKAGEGRRLVVPPSLGYGERGAGGRIPGGATLYFDVELVEIGNMAKIGPEQEKWLA
eukprot:CAMPEP_0197444858 /NCGR_PEP_ID=MMETSP1175-20131217/10219_1 /TAXON_ID=1003142 /ORGANISM="Triceratium dubium, Strain CCMP147" /LENGTH=201 /DNA_ID=CAMNT_0042975719 /DNA_START=158 /DNA_END=759 /DNA_ORIENTATION=-